jgi:hypothetical protein
MDAHLLSKHCWLLGKAMVPNTSATEIFRAVPRSVSLHARLYPNFCRFLSDFKSFKSPSVWDSEPGELPTTYHTLAHTLCIATMIRQRIVLVEWRTAFWCPGRPMNWILTSYHSVHSVAADAPVPASLAKCPGLKYPPPGAADGGRAATSTSSGTSAATSPLET